MIPIYEAGETDGLLYVAVRYVEGSDLGSLLKDVGRLEPSRALGLLEQVAIALDAGACRQRVRRKQPPNQPCPKGRIARIAEKWLPMRVCGRWRGRGRARDTVP